MKHGNSKLANFSIFKNELVTDAVRALKRDIKTNFLVQSQLFFIHFKCNTESKKYIPNFVATYFVQLNPSMMVYACLF